MKTIAIDVDDTVYALLEALTHGEYAPQSVEDVVLKLIDHAQQGVYRPGARERDWLMQTFGDDWTAAGSSRVYVPAQIYLHGRTLRSNLCRSAFGWFRRMRSAHVVRVN